MTEREAFEAAERLRSPGVSLVRFGQSTGSMHDSYPYIDPLVHARWEGWQAAAARYEGVVDVARETLAWLTEEPNVPCYPATFPERLRQALAALDGGGENRD